MTSPAEDEFSELVDADIPRVDLVDKAANGTRFLIAKAQSTQGLLSPDLVRDLIGKTAAQPGPAAPKEDTVTMTGSPGAIAKLMHEAALRSRDRDDFAKTTETMTYEQVVKAKYNADDLKRMAANGQAMDDESYPIADREDLDRAIRAVGRGGSSHDAIRRHIITRARSLGASSEIPNNWNKDGSLQGDVAKEMDMDGALDAMTALAEPEDDYAGMNTDPGSPAWEAVDAATARKWLAILARAKNAIDMLADREMLEAAAGDEDDAENAFDLQDACCAIDYAISVLAPFAVAEQAEADCCDEMQMVGKALASFDAAPLDTIEALASITKAGRVLSASNEAAIRGAVESLQKVLASLPQAPTTEGVTKTANEEGDMPKPTPSADVTAAAGQEPAMGSQQADPKPVAGQPVTDMAKADGEKTPMVVVYDQKGRLIGIVDPDDVTPVTNSEADADDMPAADDGDESDDGAAAPKTTDLEPAPPAEVGTPADAVPADDDAVTKTTHESATSEEVLKSSFLAAVEQVFKTHSATQEEAIAKTGVAVLELADMVETLKGRLQVLEEQPAEPRVFTNGAVPPAHLMRGQDRGAVQVDMAKAREQKDRLYKAADATEQNRIAQDMQSNAIDVLAAIHQQQRRG